MLPIYRSKIKVYERNLHSANLSVNSAAVKMWPQKFKTPKEIMTKPYGSLFGTRCMFVISDIS